MTWIAFYLNNYMIGSILLDKECDIVLYNKSALYINFCMLALVFGYILPIKKNKIKKYTFFSYFPSESSIILCCIFSFILTLIFLVIGYKTTHSAVLDKSTILDIPLVINNAVQAIIYFIYFKDILSTKKLKKITRLCCLVVILEKSFVLILSGSRSGLVYSFFVALYLYILIHKKIPYKYIIMAFIFLLIIVPFSFIYRDQALFTSTSGRDIFGKIKTFKDSMVSLSSNDTANIIQTIRVIFGRVGVLHANVRIFRYMPERVDYQYGATIFPHIITSSIPTFIYPNKPLTNIGKWFGVNFGLTDSKNPVFITAGILNELFINFGFLGIIFAFMYSRIIKQAEYYWKYNKESLLINLSFYIFYFRTCLFFNESYIVNGIMIIFRESVIIFIVLCMLYGIDRHKGYVKW
jgi:hypothetical protein